MNEPLFLMRDEALAIHADMIDRYGGSGGVRDAGLLDSALAQPQATFGGQFLCTDVAEMAAAYLPREDRGRGVNEAVLSLRDRW